MKIDKPGLAAWLLTICPIVSKSSCTLGLIVGGIGILFWYPILILTSIFLAVLAAGSYFGIYWAEEMRDRIDQPQVKTTHHTNNGSND